MNQDTSRLLNKLRKGFDITCEVSSEISTYLSLQIERLADGSIFMHQESYAKKILHRCKMEDVDVVAIPANPHHQMCADVHKNGHQEA